MRCWPPCRPGVRSRMCHRRWNGSASTASWRSSPTATTTSWLSNVANIGVPIDRVITAEQAGAYKPSPVIFDYALRALGCAPDEILHVAQGFEYDIVPAHALGWSRVWINRYGKSGDPAYGPYHELPDLSGLPALLGIDAVILKRQTCHCESSRGERRNRDVPRTTRRRDPSLNAREDDSFAG